MKEELCDRAVILGQYILENNATVRSAAKAFGISKSTVHMAVYKGRERRYQKNTDIAFFSCVKRQLH